MKNSPVVGLAAVAQLLQAVAAQNACLDASTALPACVVRLTTMTKTASVHHSLLLRVRPLPSVRLPPRLIASHGITIVGSFPESPLVATIF